MIHPHTKLEYINAEVGHGVFATQFIPAGTITYVEDFLDIKIQPDDPILEHPDYRDIIEHFSFIDGSGVRVISWDHAKFVNHCCEFNTISTGYGFEIAVRDIYPNEEITDEYALFNMGYEMPLSCNCTHCRKRLVPEDFENHYQEWDAQIQEALRKLTSVEQPLMPFMDNATKTDLDHYLESGSEYKSVLTLKYDRNKVCIDR